MRKRSTLTRSTLATGAAFALILLAGCGQNEPDVVSGTGGPSSASTSGSGASGGPAAAAAGEPLTAADLPGWADATVPEYAAASLVQPCGEPTGARDQQSAVRSAALSTPTGITVLNQVADYDQADPVKVINETITSALLACPGYSTDTHDVTVRGLPTSSTSPMAGVEIVRRDRETGMRDVTVYWAALTGKRTVEVSVSATLGAVGESPLETFALNVLGAAQAKATGAQIPTVSAPTLPEAQTAEQAQAALDAAEAERQQVAGDGGIDEGDVTIVDEGVANEIGAGLPTDWRNQAPTPGYTGEGETGPGTIGGYADDAQD